MNERITRRTYRGAVAASGLALVLAAVGCDGSNDGGRGSGSSNDAAAGDADAALSDGGDGGSDAVADGGIDCQAGAVVECAEENTQSIVKCQEDGQGTTPASCPPKTVCREAECVDVTCVPGRRRCRNGKQGPPEKCNQEGTGWKTLEACGEGSKCSAGSCLDRCQLADKQNSYKGCEYWAGELQNHLLYEERKSGDTIPSDRLPPFAVVLANTSSEYDATVDVYKAPGKPARVIGSRTVGTDIQTPDVVTQTVHSELLRPDGTRKRLPDGKKLTDVPLPKKSMLTLILPNHKIPDGKSTVQRSAFHVKSSQPVVAYQFNPYCCNYNYTNDASLLLPESALTKNYMYMSYPVWDAPNREEGDTPEAATLNVLATQPDTEVTIDLPKSERFKPSQMIHSVADDQITAPDDQGRVKVDLQPHDILNLEGAKVGVDLTGARIESNKPVSVFGAHSCTFVPFSQWACDHLESQLFPMETWGQRFVAVPLKKRAKKDRGFTREGTYWKFLARKDDTRIETGLDLRLGPQAGEGVPPCKKFSPNPKSGVIELDARETCEFGTKKMFVAEADKPVLLGAFLSGQQSVGENVQHAGDPSFFLVPPREQYRREYSFLTPQTYHQDYMTLSLPVGYRTITLDGERKDVTNFDYQKFPDRGFARVHIPVEPGAHRVSARLPFGVVVYGYDDYVSYAYTGGLDLAKRSPVSND
ncbi:MAG: hypothetical protein ABEL76_16420 [Bradymonadaceae bacterium]